MNKFLIYFLVSVLSLGQMPALAQSYPKGPAYIFGTTTVTTSGGTTTLTKDSNPIQILSGTNSQTVVLPSATTLPVGRGFEFYSTTTKVVTIQANGGTVLKTLAPNEKSQLRLTANGTAAGTWAVENNAAVNASFATDWATDTITGSWTTGATYSAKSRIVGDQKEYQVKVTLTANPTAAALTLTLPTPIDTTKLAATTVADGNSILKGSNGFLRKTAAGEALLAIAYSSATVVTVFYQRADQVPLVLGTVTNTAPFTLASGDALNVNFSVPYAGGAQNAVRMDQAADLMGTTFYSGKATCPANSLIADGSAVSRTTYAGLFQNIGTTFGTGDGSTTFNVPDLRGVFVKGSGSQTIGGITYSGTLGTKQGDQMQGHVHGTAQAYATFATGSAAAFVGSGGTVLNQSTIGGPQSDGTNGTPRTGTETRPANIAMTPCIWHVSQNAPLLVGGVTSGSTGLERMERLHVNQTCTSSPCTLAGKSSDWATVTRAGAGSYALSITAGIFSAAPTCTLTCQFGAPCTSTAQGNMSTSGFGFVTVRTDNGTSADAGFQIVCMGPR
jgi:microcystin-dependent protein